MAACSDSTVASADPKPAAKSKSKRGLKRTASNPEPLSFRTVAPRKTSGFSKVETVAAQMVADLKNMCTPFVGAKGYRRRIQKREERWQQTEGFVEDGTISEAIGVVVNKIDHYVKDIKITIESTRDIKA